jgi:poly-gamma-glutamate capsule biosynthesis protein CapA/YwtB (metallophosphatase superfamily)
LGTHSGTVQTVEVLTSPAANGKERQTLCAYSLGNLLISNRSDRSAISGALLHVSMRYSLADDSLTFDTLTYTPTYVWRGKIDGKSTYRVLVSNAQPPDYVAEDQQNVMERSLSLVRDKFAESIVSEAP